MNVEITMTSKNGRKEGHGWMRCVFLQFCMGKNYILSEWCNPVFRLNCMVANKRKNVGKNYL